MDNNDYCFELDENFSSEIGKNKRFYTTKKNDTKQLPFVKEVDSKFELISEKIFFDTFKYEQHYMIESNQIESIDSKDFLISFKKFVNKLKSSSEFIITDKVYNKYLEDDEYCIFLVLKVSDTETQMISFIFNRYLHRSGEFKYISCLIEIHTSDNNWSKVKSFIKANVQESFKIIDLESKDLQNQQQVTIPINWLTSSSKGLLENLVLEKIDDNFYQESYPNIKDLDIFIDDYINSDESILILFGEPGTGKTRLIRKIIKQMKLKYESTKTIKKSKELLDEDNEFLEDDMSFDILEKDSFMIQYTFDENILGNDQFYKRLAEQDSLNGLVLEDFDTKLAPRKDKDNIFQSIMTKLLNISDGILTSKKLKIIITTNLDNLDGVDGQIIRPGRCFGVVKFRKMTYQESKDLLTLLAPIDYNELQINLREDKEYTLSEIYRISKLNKYKNRTNNSENIDVLTKKIRKMGF